MPRSLIVACAIGLLVASPALAQTTPAPVQLLSERRMEAQPSLMVPGTAYLANNNRDVLRTEVDDVMSPTRQAEIAAVVEALARWRPTRIAVEIRSGIRRRWTSDTPTTVPEHTL